MVHETPPTLRPSIDMRVAKTPTAAHRIFDAMRRKIQEVFPDEDSEAWEWQSEDYAMHEIERPDHDFQEWFTGKFQSGDECTQRFVRRMFTIWQEMEEKGFTANGLELYEHQKALFAWITLTIRQEISSLLVRSPYGSGKSLIAGLTVRAFREMQEEMIVEGSDPKTIPTGALLGLRKEHMLQNALGQQYAVLQPPYTVERGDVNVYYRNLATMFGENFTNHFVKPQGKQHPFYELFSIDEDEDDRPEAATRLARYFSAMDAARKKSWDSLPNNVRMKILETLEALIEGKIVFIPDVYNVPQPETPLPREENFLEEGNRYRGDSAYALAESPHYRVKATHKHLALDRTTYTTKPNLENPAQFCIAYGSMLTRAPENIRADIREEIMPRGKHIYLDEAGSYTPGSLGDSMADLSGEWPFIVGFTGQDRGIEGWAARSPQLSIRQMIALRLMKPIAFMGLGNAENPPTQGSEEAWAEYRKHMSQNEKTATTLHLPQPHELDTVVVAPAGQLREYAHRILQAHEEEGKPVKIWCFDPQAGDSRWSIVVNGFNAPKKEGDPRRILIAPPSQMAEALHLHAECYDILTNMNRFSIDQTCGRLGHIRNRAGTESQQEKARTYFRMLWLEGASGEAYVREVARKMGYTLDDDGETWVPLQCMIDADAYARDQQRTCLSEPQPIPDSRAVRKRKGRKKAKRECTPLRITSAYVLEQERKRAEREAPRDILPLQKPSLTPEVVEANDMPGNLEQLAKKFGVHAYYGSLSATVRTAYKAGVRGKALNNVVLNELFRLQEVVSARHFQSQAISKNSEASERYIGVSIHPLHPGKFFSK